MNNIVAIITALFYLAILFGVAYFAEYRLKKGKSVINNGYVYALSLAVYCTAWTYYGSVGRAATNGLEFLAIYLGPTISAILFWPVLRKIIRICKSQSINSIADLISTRYGKNFSVAVIVTVLCVTGIIPYISLQLKAISNSIHIIANAAEEKTTLSNFLYDDTIYIAIILALFIILFGTRSIDASEKHEGLVAAVAFESVIKLAAFLAAGIFVVYGVFNGFGDVFTRAFNDVTLKNLFQFGSSTSYGTWLGLMMVSLLAVVFLPRQFQVSVVENMNEQHLKKATWLFPLYLLLINIFVLPIALSGKLIFTANNVDADTFVLALPLYFNQNGLSLFVFIGGFSAATSMIIVETIALSTMMSNNIATPLFLRVKKFKSTPNGAISKSIIHIRRVNIFIIIALAYLYDKTIAQNLSLVSIGLVSFVAVAQFAPAAIGGIYWKDASKNGAVASIVVGFIVWFFTLVVPSLVSAGVLSNSIMVNGLWGIGWLKPFSLFGLQGFDSITHATFWSLLFNIIVFVSVSLNSKKSTEEIYQGEIFVDIFKHTLAPSSNVMWKGTANLPDVQTLLENFLGKERAQKLITNYAQRNKISLDTKSADPRLVTFAERILSGIIGSASASIMVSSVIKAEEVKIDEVINILRESQQMIELNKELKKKSTELQKATQQLTQVNEQLKEMDSLKDEFLYTVTHEIRTPITSIRAMAEIVHDNTDMPETQRQQFLGNVIKETERLSHLIKQVLNLERYESGQQRLNMSEFVLNKLINDTVAALHPLANEKSINIQISIPNTMFLIRGDAPLLQQVLQNLLSNAIKFVDDVTGKIKVSVHLNYDEVQVWVEDNGAGIDEAVHELIFDKFFQAKNQTLKKPEGSGLGLAISKKIIEMHGGKIWVENGEVNGSRFIFTIPNS
ncbi:ATP-binding protein [Ferruginibacter yonginensis]|uniref:histidine kinase n=1 Tax=Ferruginibacter yonginensis TaxID=1310416 RepID=A0ABV8QUA0_9BACT